MIDSFRGENRFLSNFYPCTIQYRGVFFPSSENAYQAAKCKNDDVFVTFNSLTPSESKKAGQTVDLITDWDERKLAIMKEILITKFSDPELARMLLLTDDQHLIEGNSHGDTYWGVCDGEGLNHLGLILMDIREGLRKSS